MRERERLSKIAYFSCMCSLLQNKILAQLDKAECRRSLHLVSISGILFDHYISCLRDVERYSHILRIPNLPLHTSLQGFDRILIEFFSDIDIILYFHLFHFK